MPRFLACLPLILGHLFAPLALGNSLVQDRAGVLSSETFGQLLHLTHDVRQRTTAEPLHRLRSRAALPTLLPRLPRRPTSLVHHLRLVTRSIILP